MDRPIPNNEQASNASFLDGGGELGALMRAFDWSATPLGPPEHWPRSLKTAVRIMLTSRQPFWLGWGPELTYLYNDPYKSIIGGKHPRALGRPFAEVWREIWDVVGPMADTVMTRDEGIYVEAQLLIMERHGYQEETHYTFSYSPIPGDDGRPGGLICANTDDTRRVIGERQMALLRELAARAANARTWQDACSLSMEAIGTNARDLPFALLYIAEAPGKPPVLAAASRDTGGLDAPALWPWAEAMHEQRAQVVPLDAFHGELPMGDWPRPPSQAAVLPIAASGKTGRSGALVVGLNPFRRYDDDYRGFLELVSGQISAAIANAEAYEQEKRRAESLAELDRAKTAFFSNVSHEFRTPLTLMLGPIDELALRHEDDASPEARELLAMMQRNGQRLLKLVNTLLDFARIEAGRAQTSFEATDLAALTAELASNFQAACARAGIHLAIDCAPLAEPAWIDRDMWEKVVLNLLSNAFKFTFSGEIAVAVRDAGTGFELAVRDTGTGIPAAALPHMFERFYRVEGARGRSHEGSGIGLALVHELVKLHGGTIAVASRPGEGTEFTVWIPKGHGHLPAARIKAPRESVALDLRADAYVAEALSWLPEAQAAAPARASGGARVLIADDNADLREYARRLLAASYEVEAVGDGVAALEAARARPPDIIVSDVMMPRLDGLGLVRELRNDPALRTIPVVLLSARAGDEAQLQGLASGADGYLTKPFSARELLVRVGSLLQSAQLRRKASEELELNAARIKALLDSAPLGMYLVDDAFRLVAVNPIARPVFGDIPDLLGRDFDELIHILWPKAFADEIVAHFRRTLETGRPYVEAERIEQRLDSGVTEYYEWRIDRIPLQEGRHGVVCYFRDVSKSVMDRQALREADRRKDEFLATLSHELRNPLAPLRNSLHVLRSVRGSDPAALRVQDMMERQVNHLVRLVDDLLEMSRISRGVLELKREPVDIATVVRNAVETSDPLIQGAGHRLTVKQADEALWVEGDAVRLAQILANILNNAAKYTDAGGAIAVEARREGGQVAISVADNGPGIGADALPRIFEMFNRGEHGRHHGGLGIGLSLARRLAQMHGGSLVAASEGPGRGSEFTLRLPLMARRADHAPANDAPAACVGRRRVLVVDDHVDAADSLAMILKLLGAEVHVARDGYEALATLEDYPADTVLLDIGMPGMDGYETARRIRARFPARRIVLIALTGWGQEQDRQRARDAGFDHHIVKPAEIGALQSLLAAQPATDAEPAVL